MKQGMHKKQNRIKKLRLSAEEKKKVNFHVNKFSNAKSDLEEIYDNFLSIINAPSSMR